MSPRLAWAVTALGAALGLPRVARAQNMDSLPPAQAAPAPEVRERATLLAAHLPDEIQQVGVTTALFGLVLATVPGPYSQYVDHLGSAGLRVATAPTATGGAVVLVSGQF